MTVFEGTPIARWNFISNDDGGINGISESGIETFKGRPYRSLAREICQNSLDARWDKNKPVKVEFALSQINVRELPGYSDLRDALNRCKTFWDRRNNKKTTAFLDNAMRIYTSGRINLLRISDFNTTGLTGSDKTDSTPWFNLVKASGVSGKGGTDGGSYGIGKAAPFACSGFRTVYYTTKDTDGLKAFQGVTKLVSFENRKDGRTYTSTGTGYYGNPEKNKALPTCMSVDAGYSRSSAGTDIFVAAFNAAEEWDKEMIASVLEDFLLAIYKGTIEVVINGVTINHETLPGLVEEYKDKAKGAYDYYQVIVSPEKKEETIEVGDLGSVRLMVLIGNGLNRRVLMSRINGMKIFDKANISSTIQFSGICFLNGERINAFFRDMENPQHDAWEPDRTDDPKKAREYQKILYSKIKDCVVELGRTVITAEMDAEGIGDFLPDDVVVNNSSQEKTEIVSDKTSSVEIQIAKQQNWQKGFENALEGEEEHNSLGSGKQTRTDFGHCGGKEHANGHNNTHKNDSPFGAGDGDGVGPFGDGEVPFPDGDNEDAEGMAFVPKVGKAKVMRVRVFCTDSNNHSYRLTFIPRGNYENAYVQIKLSGEQSGFPVDVLYAEMDEIGLAVMKNKIFLNNPVKADQKVSIDFELDYDENCAMEVNLYGNPI